MGAWVTAISAQASDMSGWLLIGLPAAAYVGGFSIVWTCIGCACGSLFNWTILAPRLRRQTEEYGALTLPDYFAARFNDRTHVLRVLSVVIIVAFYASYIAAQFIAAGEVFATTFGTIDLPWGQENMTFYHQGMLIGAAIILLYTAAGGFLAVAWTDLVQGMLMVFAVVVLPIVGLWQIGGFDKLVEAMSSAKLGGAMITLSKGSAGPGFVFGVVLSGLSWGLGYPAQPHILSRFMAIQDPKKLPVSTIISVVWVVLALWGSMFVGLVALAILGPDLSSAEVNQVMPRLTLTLLHPVLAGLLLSAALAAMMSTVDSMLLVAVAAVVNDIYEKLFGGHPSGRVAVWLSRLVVVGLGIGGVVIAWGGKNVFDQVFDAWSGLAAGLGAPIILALTWKGTGRWGVALGMLVGVLLIFFWPVPAEGASSTAETLYNLRLFITMAISAAVIVVVSMMERPSASSRMRLGHD